MLQLALRLEPEQGKFIELFQGVNLKRTGIVIGMNFFQQATGSAFVSTYGTLYVRDLGTVNAFSFSIIVSCCNIFMVSIGLFLSDRLGRRSVLFIGGSLQLATIITIAALGTGTPTYATKTGIVSLLAVFSGAFVLGWAPITYVVTTEVPALRLRDASQRTAAIVFVVTSFVVNFTIPYLLNAPYANLGSKLGFIFGGVSLCALVFTYLCVPECKGKPLEQVERLFNEGVPLRHFGRYGHDSAATYLDQEKGTNVVEVAHAEKI
jgi:SP family sugar:H+ symporter-like MFS transporter